MDKSQLIAKYAKKFVSKDNITKGVCYHSSGSIFATNRVFALIIRNAHTFEQTMVMDLKSGMPLEGIYSDITKAIPNRIDCEIEIKRSYLDAAVLRVRCVADVATRLNKNHPVGQLDINGSAYLRVSDSDRLITASAFIGNVNTLDPSKRNLNVEYLYTALSLFKDADSDLVFIKLKGPLDPIVLTDGKDIDVIIMPYRVSEGT